MCHDDTIMVWTAHSDVQSVPGTVLLFGLLNFVFDGLVESSAGVIFAHSQPDTLVSAQGGKLEEPRYVKSRTNRVLDLIGRDMAADLGPN